MPDANKSSTRLELGSISGELKNVVLPMGLVVEKITFRGQDAVLENKPFRINIDRPMALEVTVSAEAIAAFLEAESPAGLRNFKIEIRDQKLYVQAVKTVLVEIKALAVATLRIKDEKLLYIELESVDIMGAGAKNLVQSQLDRINPVLDATELPLDARLLELNADNGYVVLRGTARP